MKRLLQCEMDDACKAQVTHIGAKGYIYCAGHVLARNGWERCRALRPWEKRLLAEGNPVPSYKPITRAQYLARGTNPKKPAVDVVRAEWARWQENMCYCADFDGEAHARTECGNHVPDPSLGPAS